MSLIIKIAQDAGINKKYKTHTDNLDREMLSAIANVGTAIQKAYGVAYNAVKKNRSGSSGVATLLRGIEKDFKNKEAELKRLAAMFNEEEID